MKYVVPPTSKVCWRLNLTRLLPGLPYLYRDLGVTERGNRKEGSQQTVELSTTFSSEFLLPIICWFVTVHAMSKLKYVCTKQAKMWVGECNFSFHCGNDHICSSKWENTKHKIPIGSFEMEWLPSFQEHTLIIWIILQLWFWVSMF